jgi:hypothetical protein
MYDIVSVVVLAYLKLRCHDPPSSTLSCRSRSNPVSGRIHLVSASKGLMSSRTSTVDPHLFVQASSQPRSVSTGPSRPVGSTPSTPNEINTIISGSLIVSIQENRMREVWHNLAQPMVIRTLMHLIVGWNSCLAERWDRRSDGAVLRLAQLRANDDFPRDLFSNRYPAVRHSCEHRSDQVVDFEIWC